MDKNLSKPNFRAGVTQAYMLCGWRTLSEIPLTGVPRLVNDVSNVDVTIHIATGHPPLAKSTGRFVFRHTTQCSLVRIEGVADFEITDGRQIRVWPAAGA